MSDFARAATALGYDEEPPSWQFSDREPVPVAQWGKDHWSVLAYAEYCAVEHRGLLDHTRMRCNASRHPLLMSAKSVITLSAVGDGSGYPTRLKAAERPGADGRFGVRELPDHDDYDCLEDAVAAGLLTVTMPRRSGDSFRDARNRPVRELCGNTVIEPGAVTGVTESDLMASASWSLTDLGWTVASQLREHKASGGNFHGFVPALGAAA